MSHFHTTRWSIVLQATGNGQDARAALESLCRTYRAPVLAFIRGRGYRNDVAEDLTQSFFASFLEREDYAAANPARGRFRAYLLTAIRHFLVNSAETANTAKRGGRVSFESIDEVADENSALSATGETPEAAFEQAWALVILNAALRRLRDEARLADKLELFDQLRDFLIEVPDDDDYARVAARLGMRRNTVAVSVHRLRLRLRELVQEEVAQTAADRAGLETELRELRHAFGTAM
jgi:RNA polymerase sigma-70 factor (ECF subfamily)